MVGTIDRDFSRAAGSRYSPVFHSFMPIQVEGRAREEKGGRLGLLVGCGGFTESGAPHSSLSFLNGLFVGKAVASERPGVKLQNPAVASSNCTPSSTGWPTCKSLKAKRASPLHCMYHDDARLRVAGLPPLQGPSPSARGINNHARSFESLDLLEVSSQSQVRKCYAVRKRRHREEEIFAKLLKIML